MFGETDSYQVRITSIRKHIFEIGISGFVVDGIFRDKSDLDEQYIYLFQVQTDSYFIALAAECIKRVSDQVMDRQGKRYPDICYFVSIPNEVLDFVESISNMRKGHSFVVHLDKNKRR